MSDSSDIRDSDTGESEDEYGRDVEPLDYEQEEDLRRYRDHDDVHEDGEVGADDDEEEGEHVQEDPDPPKLDKQNLKLYKLCPDHEAGKMTKSCPTCARTLSLITDKNIINQLCSESKDSSLSARYSGHCDTVVPTLKLDPDTVGPLSLIGTDNDNTDIFQTVIR